MDIVLYALTSALYVGLAAYAWRAQRIATSSVTQTPIWSRGLLLLTWLAHGVLLHNAVFPADHMVFGFAHAMSAMLWLGVGVYWLESCFFALDGLRLLLLPTAAWVCLLPLVFSGGSVVAHAANPLFKFHFLVANMAYGLLALAAFHALIMMVVEQRLHHVPQKSNNQIQRWAQQFFDALPALLTLEKLLFRLIGFGFISLTLTIFTGSVFSEELFGKAFQWNHKVVFSIISWLMFGGLLLGRRVQGWRGQQALRWVIASFGFLLLAYMGSRFVMEVLLQRV